MAVQDPELRTLLARAKAETKEFPVGGVNLKFARLNLNDEIELDRALGINFFAELAESVGQSREGQAAPGSRAWRYEVQRYVFWLSLRREYPELTIEEAGELSSLLDPREFWGILAWIVGGVTPEAPLS